MNTPLVSIIVPIYGVERYIKKCAQSIFEQTYYNIEILFVNDCTPDNSIKILTETINNYPRQKNKIKILSYEYNKGLAGARKYGIEHAKGKYILQIDSDDYISQHMVENMVYTAEKDNAEIVICDFNIIKNKHQKHLIVNPSLNPKQCMKQVLTGQVHSSVANKLILKDLYTTNNIFPIEGLNMREDLSVMYRLLFFAKKLAYIPKPFYNYVLRDNSISSSRMNISQQQNSQKLISLMNNFCIKEQIKDPTLLEAFSLFKAHIKVEIILYGNIENIDSHLFNDVNYKLYIKHPQLSKSQKIIGIICSSNKTCILKLCNKLLKYK